MTVDEILVWMKRHASKKTREELLPRYGIQAENAIGVTVANLRDLAKELGRNHALALELWKTGIYDCRMLAPFLGEPEKLTVAEMNTWCADFDNWAVCDAACFHLFDKSPLALKRIPVWAKSKQEFVRRGAFALMASVALHQKKLPDADLIRLLPLADAAANDDRNFVKKAVSWAIRSFGRRGTLAHEAALDLGRQLAASENNTRRWIGKDVVKDLEKKRSKRG